MKINLDIDWNGTVSDLRLALDNDDSVQGYVINKAVEDKRYYEVTVTEQLKRRVYVLAETECDAENYVQELYDKCELVLDYQDFIGGSELIECVGATDITPDTKKYSVYDYDEPIVHIQG